MISPYKDNRTEFFREFFGLALPYSDYLLNSPNEHQSRWQAYAHQLKLSTAQEAVLSTFVRRMPVLVLSGSWCGDCARQGPMLNLIATNAPALDLRFIDNKQFPALQDELRINGAEKVPVVVCFSEDFFELSRFGDRHLSVYRRKLATEFGAACDPGFGGSEAELGEELGEWINHFERCQAILRLAPMLRRRYGD